MPGVVSLVGRITNTSHALEIATATSRQPGINVTVASFYDDKSPTDCEVSVVPLQANSRFDVKAFVRLYRLLRRKDVDILHTHDNFIGSVARFLGTIAGVEIVDTEHRQHDAYTHLQNAVNVPTLPLADYVVANSETTKRSFLAIERILLNPDRVRVIYNGVDVDRMDSATTDRAEEDEGDVRIITVGRLVPVKDQKTLLDAFSHLLETSSNVRLKIVGDGPLRDELEEYSRSLGIQEDVHFLGDIPREEVYRQLAASDVFALPSISEGFCVAAVEAMATGLPVVVSDIDVLHEVIGDSGVYVEPGNSKSFADAIRELVEHPENRDKLGRLSRKQARSKFTLERTSNEYIKLYQELAGSSDQ